MITKVSSSNLARVMTCAGSLYLEDLSSDEKSPRAEEGTAFGEYVQLKIERKQVPTHASNGVPFDLDMKVFGDSLAQEILTHSEGHPIVCEGKVDWMTRSGIKISARYDESYSIGSTLYIRDTKYGWGIVEVFENWQLIPYAIGEVIRRQQVFEKIVLIIDQPRPHHEDGPSRAWELTYPELLEYKERIEKRMDDIAAGEKSLVTSPRCKYCNAGPGCPAISKAFYRGVDLVQHFVQDNIDDKELAFQLDLIDRIDEVVKVRKDSLRELAVSRIAGGKIIPGYVTEQSLGNRTWKPDITPEAIEIMTGKSILESKMLSPAQAEKIGIPKKFVEGVTMRPFLGNKLKKKDSADLGNKLFGAHAPTNKKELSNVSTK